MCWFPSLVGVIGDGFPQTFVQLCVEGNPDASGFWLIQLSFEYYFVNLFLTNWWCESICESAGSSCDNSDNIILVILPEALAANAGFTITSMWSTKLLFQCQHVKGPTIIQSCPKIPLLKVWCFLIYEQSGLDYLASHVGQIPPKSFWYHQRAFEMSRDSVTTYHSIYPAMLQHSHLKPHLFSSEIELLAILSMNPWMAKMFPWLIEQVNYSLWLLYMVYKWHSLIWRK